MFSIGLKKFSPVLLVLLLAFSLFCGEAVLLAGGVIPPVEPAATQEAVTAEEPIATWFGLIPKLSDAGITPELSYIMDSSRNFHGGQSTNNCAVRYLLTVGLSADTEKLFNLKGGTFYVQFQDYHGREGSQFVGDLQGYSNIDSERGIDQLSEIWYEQKLFDDTLRFKLGKIDANTEFGLVENGVEFVNSSFTCCPTIADFPCYPDQAFGALVFAYPAEWFYAGVGIFDGSAASGVLTGSNGPKSAVCHPTSEFLIGEAGLKWKFGASELPGRLAAGAWGHTGNFETFDGGERDGAAGPYVVFDQTLWRENPGNADDAQGLGAFFQYGWADQQISEITQYYGGGLAWTGLIPTRDKDVLGAGMSMAVLSDVSGAEFTRSQETAVETFYKVQFTDWISLKPDLQYIVNPGGQGLPNALVGTLRLELAW